MYVGILTAQGGGGVEGFGLCGLRFGCKRRLLGRLRNGLFRCFGDRRCRDELRGGVEDQLQLDGVVALAQLQVITA